MPEAQRVRALTSFLFGTFSKVAVAQAKRPPELAAWCPPPPLRSAEHGRALGDATGRSPRHPARPRPLRPANRVGGRARVALHRAKGGGDELAPKDRARRGANGGGGGGDSRDNKEAAAAAVASAAGHAAAAAAGDAGVGGTGRGARSRARVCGAPRVALGACLSAALCAVVAWRRATRGDDDGGGGWRPASASELRQLGTDVCTIDRLSIDDVTQEVFDRVYRYRKPLIIKFPNGARQWCDADQWTASSIRQVYGGWNVSTGKAVELVYSGGKPDSQDTFGRFIDEMRSSSRSAADPWYLFDRTFYPTSALPRSVRPPGFLFMNEDSIFFLGSSGTGATFHKHMPAWNGVVFGRKRWFLYPIDKTPPGGLHGYNTAAWLRNVYPNLTGADKPIECVQEAGEIFYVPESYYHAVLNLGETIAVSLQLRTTVTELETKFYKALNTAYRAGVEEEGEDSSAAEENRMRLAKEAVRIYTELHHDIPGNTEVIYEIAGLFHTLKQQERAKRLLERVISMDRFYVKAYLSLAYWYEDRGMEAEQEQMYKLALQANPDSKEAWKEYADLLLRQERYSEANEAYAKHLSLADVKTSEGAVSGRMLTSLNHMLKTPKKPEGHRGPKITTEKPSDRAWRAGTYNS